MSIDDILFWGIANYVKDFIMFFMMLASFNNIVSIYIHT